MVCNEGLTPSASAYAFMSKERAEQVSWGEWKEMGQGGREGGRERGREREREAANEIDVCRTEDRKRQR